MNPWAADPGSCSRLGGALCTSAARLAEHAAGLDGRHREHVREVAFLLEGTGSRLQTHAQELADLAARASRLRARAAAVGLHLDDLRVREPAHGLDVDEHRARRHVQDQADRIAARLGRSRAQLVRRLREAGARLDLVASAGAPGAFAPPRPGSGIG